MDGVKVASGNRGMTVVAERQLATALLGTVFFRTALPCSGGYHLERGGCRNMMRLG